MTFKQLINPHAHSDGSLDGAASVMDIVEVNQKLGATHVTLTEHGNLNTAMDLYNACNKKFKGSVKPILGIELYLEPPFIDKLRQQYAPFFVGKTKGEEKLEKKLRESYVHLTVHFKDSWAWSYFCRLTPAMEQRAVVKWGESKPICKIDELQGAAGHITICSSCMAGVVQRWLVPDRITGKIYPEEAEKAYHMMRDIAGKDNFFVELFPHHITHNWKRAQKDKSGKIISSGQFVPHECNKHIIDGDLQKFPNQFVWSLAKKNGDRCIISLDSHFAYPEQKVIQDAKLGNGQESWKFYNSYHVYSSSEAAEMMKQQMGVSNRDVEEWIDNSYQWASLFDDFKLTTSEDRWVIPSLPEDWKKQTRDRIDRYGRMNWNDPVMVSRLQKELKLFANNGKINLMPYFFTVEDVARFCRENGILMNVRGSAGGVLLLYLFNVCAFNPLLHDLSLDRFLTYGRIDSNTLPDVDMDVSDKDKVIKYLEDTYQDGFCKISTDMMLKLKSSIKDAERYVKGSVSLETEKLCKKLPMSPQGGHEYEFVFGSTDQDGNHTPGVIDYDKDLQEWTKKNSGTWKIVEQMLGIQRQKSVHACGCVIADEPIQNYCPIIFIKGNKATGFNPKSVEDIGLIKFDFLGVNTLKDIELCVESVKTRLGKDIDPWVLPHDENVMKMFHNGDTATVFQFDSQTVVPYLKKIKPKDIEELAQVTALCRPGTLDALDEDGKRTLAEVYVARRQGEPVKYVHPDMEAIIGDTMGIALFQEQTLKIFKILAEYSDEKTEVARRGIGKKKKEVLESCMADLRNGCYKRGWTEKQVDLLIDQIMASARYSFNKSHSISYAYVAYACAWLRYHFPLDWWKAVLSNSDKDEIVTKWWPFVKDLVVEPNVNTPADSFIIDDGKLITPLSFLKGVGDKAFLQLIEEAPYKNIQDFCVKHFRKRSKEEPRSSVHSGVAHKLIVSGSLDVLFKKEKELEGTTNSLAKKLEFFEKQKAKVRNKKKPDPVDPLYTELGSTGLYLVKKKVLPTYSIDLRPLILINKGGYPDKKHPVWVLGQNRVFDGIAIRRLRELSEAGKGYWINAMAVAYVVDESIISYQNNSKQATKMFVDINGEFFETILWPKFDDETGMAPKGFKDKIVLLTYRSKPDRFSLIDVELAIKA